MTMNAPEPGETSTPAGIHPDEWAARLELAACYRVFNHLGWAELIYNHITLRKPAYSKLAERGLPAQGMRSDLRWPTS